MKDKLIPMTDYALMQEQEEFDDYKKGYLKIIEYARFLKLPLILGMFVPVDENGNVLPKPKTWDAYQLDRCRCKKCINNTLECDKYKEAKERVLFEGFEIRREKEGLNIHYYLVSKQSHISIANRIHGFEWEFFKFKTVEDLLKIGEIELTESAKKLLGYEKR